MSFLFPHEKFEIFLRWLEETALPPPPAVCSVSRRQSVGNLTLVTKFYKVQAEAELPPNKAEAEPPHSKAPAAPTKR